MRLRGVQPIVWFGYFVPVPGFVCWNNDLLAGLYFLAVFPHLRLQVVVEASPFYH